MPDPPSWSIVAGDCIDAMAHMQPASARLAFADPPYNIGVDYGDGFDDRRSPAEYLAWSRRWLEAAARLLTLDGSLWLLVNHEWSARLRIAMEDAGLHHRQTITWYETFGVNCIGKFNRCSRPLLWMAAAHAGSSSTPTPPRSGGPATGRPSTATGGPTRPASSSTTSGSSPGSPGPTASGSRGFPTQLPVELIRRVVACASGPGDLVVDPFAGSGTTGAACIELRRRFVGVEASGRFAALARERLAGLMPPADVA